MPGTVIECHEQTRVIRKGAAGSGWSCAYSRPQMAAQLSSPQRAFGVGDADFSLNEPYAQV